MKWKMLKVNEHLQTMAHACTVHSTNLKWTTCYLSFLSTVVGSVMEHFTGNWCKKYEISKPTIFLVKKVVERTLKLINLTVISKYILEDSLRDNSYYTVPGNVFI